MRAWPALLLSVLLAGCSDAPAPAEPEGLDATPEPEAPAAPGPRTITHLEEVLWEGRTKEGFFVCADADGTGACPAGQQVQPDGEHATVVSYRGNFSEALIGLEWTPADPTQTGLVLVAFGPGGILNLTRGGGALELGLDASMGLPRDGNITLAVWPEGKTETDPSLFVDVTRQSFSVVVDLSTTTVETA